MKVSSGITKCYPFYCLQQKSTGTLDRRWHPAEALQAVRLQFAPWSDIGYKTFHAGIYIHSWPACLPVPLIVGISDFQRKVPITPVLLVVYTLSNACTFI